LEEIERAAGLSCILKLVLFVFLTITLVGTVAGPAQPELPAFRVVMPIGKKAS